MNTQNVRSPARTQKPESTQKRSLRFAYVIAMFVQQGELFGAIRIAEANCQGERLSSIRTIGFGVALLLTAGGCRGPTVGLAPDLSFWVACPRLSDGDQMTLENNLYAAGFDVLNKSRLARQTRVDYFLPVQIDAMDRRGFLFSLSVLPTDSDSRRALPKVVNAVVALFSPPPTRHDHKMEQAILMMMTADLACSARHIERNDNGRGSGEMYREVVKLNRGWFEQAKALAADSNALHLH